MRGTRRRLHISLGLDEVSVQRLAAAVQPGSGARLELVSARGRRVRIANGIRPADLSDLIRMARHDNDARMELVFSGREDLPSWPGEACSH